MFAERDHHRLHHNHNHRDHLSGCSAERSGQNQEKAEEKKGIDFLTQPKLAFLDGFSSKPQELTLSYLCENPKLGFSQKGKEVIISAHDEDWVERDFMNLTETKCNPSSKRHAQDQQEEAEQQEENSSRDKKPKLDSTLNLSLALPDVSLSLAASNVLQSVDPLIKPNPTRSIQCLGAAPSHSNNNNNTQTTCSNDFTAASLSYSYSHQFSHNPSCSLTRNSTENKEYSVCRDDQIWCGGEGTNGSVHSRFRPIGDGIVALNNNNNNNSSNNHGVGFGANRATNKDSCSNSLYKITSSDNVSFFPSELPARPYLEAHSGDFRRKDLQSLRGLEDVDGGGRARKLSRAERILREIVSESIPVMAQIFQELSQETIDSTKEYLENLIAMPEKREEIVALQNRLERRSDLTKEALLKCQKDQLEILVAVKMGIGSFLSGKGHLSKNELVEIFLFMMCRNVNCKSILPVDDCECKFCSENKGFCSSCMCPLCLNFDCASNTCSWVGCDVCSHWCHAACGLKQNLIRPGPSLKGQSGMQFHCISCNHSSEMFGFVKDVFLYCAKNWGLENLAKELDCVSKIFKGSIDFKGKELHMKAEELLSKLESKIISPSDACDIIIQFFHYADSMPDFPASGSSAKEFMPTEASCRKDTATIPPATSLPPKYTLSNVSTSTGRCNSLSNDLQRKEIKAALLGDLKLADELQFGRLFTKDGFDNLESIVRIKEAEAIMFQNKADEARTEAEGFRLMIQAKSEKLDQEYLEKIAKLCLQETEQRRRKKLEELKVLENSHCDYNNMKLRMKSEISGLLERMEATKQLLV